MQKAVAHSESLDYLWLRWQFLNPGIAMSHIGKLVNKITRHTNL